MQGARNVAKFLDVTYVLGRNEIEEIGFRLAKRLRLTTIDPVDSPLWMNGWTPSEIETAVPNRKWDTGATKTAPPAVREDPPQPLSDEDKLLRKSTVAEYLLRLNSLDMVDRNHAGYMNMLLYC